MLNITSDISINQKIFGGCINCTVEISSEVKWMMKLENTKRYIDENKTRQSCEDKDKETKSFGQWLSDHQKHYKKKRFIMKHENIRRIWLAFISKYQQYFLDNETQWADTLDKV